MNHILTMNHKNERPSKMIFFDSESYVDTEITEQNILDKLQDKKIKKEHELYLICSSYINYKIGTPEELKSFVSRETLTKDFWAYVDSKLNFKEKIIVFAHNAKYDTIQTNCIKELLDMNYLVSGFSDSNPFILNFTKKSCNRCPNPVIFDEEVEMYYCKTCGTFVDKKKVRNKTIQILSSTNYYQTSLKNLGECFKIPKLEFEYEKGKMTKEQELEYCFQDVKILKTAMLKFIEFLNKEDLGNFRQTIAGQSFNAYRHRFMNKEIYIHREKNALITERQAYSGGRTEMWKKGKFTDLYYVDINSMYPSIMINHNFPTRLISFRRHMEIEEIKDWLKRGYLVSAECDVETQENVYMKKEDRLIFPTGSFTTYLNTPEVEYAIKKKHLKKVRNVCIYDNENIFKDYVEYFYNMRLKAKEQNDEIHSYLYKLFLNSLYGKFGQRNISWEKIEPAPKYDVYSQYVFEEDREGNKDTYLIKVFGGGVWREIKMPLGENESYNSFPSIAGHVTSYSRMMLWDFIDISKKENVYYMDTDSLFVNKEGYDRLIKKGCLNDSILGKLKLECLCEEVEFRGVKDYSYTYTNKEGEKIKKETIKGVSKGSIKLDDNTYVSTKWEGMSRYIKEGDINNYYNTIMIKKLKREYKKGIVLDNGNVEPYKYINNERVF